MMPGFSQSCVMLQRVPPDIKILTPGLRFFSTRSVRRPRSALRDAANNPAAPAPPTPGAPRPRQHPRRASPDDDDIVVFQGFGPIRVPRGILQANSTADCEM